MVDVTLQIILTPQTHDLGSARKNARRARRGDITRVYRTNQIQTATLVDDDWVMSPIGTTLYGYVHVRNVPPARFRRMNHVLTQNTGERTNRPTTHPVTGQPIERLILDNWRSWKWKVKVSEMPAPQRAALLADRQVTVGWAAFRDKIRRKATPNRDDQTQDDETNAVTDADLPDEDAP